MASIIFSLFVPKSCDPWFLYQSNVQTYVCVKKGKKVWYISGFFDYMQNSSILSLHNEYFGGNKVMNRSIAFLKKSLRLLNTFEIIFPVKSTFVFLFLHILTPRNWGSH